MKFKILLSGPTITKNDMLSGELKKFTSLTKNYDIRLLETFFRNLNINLLILEILQYDEFEIETIQKIRIKHPDTKIIIVDGNRDFNAQIISMGIIDIFRKPLNVGLLVERVLGILKKLQPIEIA